ncbi:MAG: sulfatase [Myxococcota bacterium]
MASPDPQPQAPARRSYLAAFLVLGAVLAFGALLFLANFSGAPTARPRNTNTDPFAAFGTSKAKTGKGGKAKAAGGGGAKAAKVADKDLWVTGPPLDRPAAPAGAKNVVFVVITAVRRDALTPYGAPADRTPYLQEVAAEGARFTDLVAGGPFSRTSAVAFLAGRHAASVDMVDPGPGPEQRVLRDDVTTLAETLRSSGWYTLGVTANFNLNTASGLAQGFDRYRDAQLGGFAPGLRVDADKAVSEALLGLSKRTPEEAARPFYLQLDLVDAHVPLLVDPAFDEQFDPDEPNVEYRSGVRRDDDAIRTLMDDLASQGHTIDTDTVFVVLSDHGEGNDDPPHHGTMHGRLLYETSVGVPWIVAGPNVPANRLIAGLASHTDVMPTVLGLVGVTAPDGIDGQSWATQVQGQGDRTTRTRAFSDTWYFTANRSSIWTDKLQCQKDFGSTGIDDAFADGCFDRTTDPTFKNLIHDPALEAELVAWRAEVSKAVSPATVPAPGAETEPGAPSSRDALLPEGGVEAEEAAPGQ